MIQKRRNIERNIALELVRVTEAAAMAAARHLGKGDKNLVDKAAVDAMRFCLGQIDMDGIVVIGEGEKDQAPMLFIGEHIGIDSPLKVDIAVDPIDGTTSVSKGLPGAISTVALAPRGSIRYPKAFHYMDKIVTGIEARDCIDINAPVAENLKNIAGAKKKTIGEVTVVVLDRPRNERLLADIRATGARIKLISDGDIAAGIDAILPEREVDVLMGIGGTPEAVLVAAAAQCLGGMIQCKPWSADPVVNKNNPDETGKVYKNEDLIDSDDVFFAATGVSTGELLQGVRYFNGGAFTQSIAMRCRSGTLRRVDAYHNFSRLDKLKYY